MIKGVSRAVVSRIAVTGWKCQERCRLNQVGRSFRGWKSNLDVIWLIRGSQMPSGYVGNKGPKTEGGVLPASRECLALGRWLCVGLLVGSALNGMHIALMSISAS